MNHSPCESFALACDNSLHRFKGTPPARQANRARPRLAKDARDAHGEAMNGPGGVP